MSADQTTQPDWQIEAGTVAQLFANAVKRFPDTITEIIDLETGTQFQPCGEVGEIRVLDTLPLPPNGKVDRLALTQKAAGQ